MLSKQYAVVSVEKTAPPEGMEGSDWHCYVIERGTSVVTGKKPGTLKQVTAHAKQVAEDLNSRTGLKGRSPYAPNAKRA
jgi:hypothetical protein